MDNKLGHTETRPCFKVSSDRPEKWGLILQSLKLVGGLPTHLTEMVSAIKLLLQAQKLSGDENIMAGGAANIAGLFGFIIANNLC